MSRAARGEAAARFKTLLDETTRLRRGAATGPTLSPGQRLLSNWQCRRLAASYADFHRHKRYRAALDFFLSDIYGPRDFSQRDADIARVYPIMVKMLSARAIESLAQAVELHTLSLRLDNELLTVLESEFGFDERTDIAELSPQRYADAYRLCANYDARVQQIELAVRAGRTLDHTVKNRMIYLTVKMARHPARMAGFGELQTFLEHGLSAFTKMKGADRFLEALRTRETLILDKIFAGAPATEWYGDVVHAIAPIP